MVEPHRRRFRVFAPLGAVALTAGALVAFPVSASADLTTTWSAPPVDVSSIASGTQKIAVSADGTKATAVWIYDDPTERNLKSRSATISGGTATWGPVVDLSVPAAGFPAEAPDIAVSADGTAAVAVWDYTTTGPGFTTVVSRSASIDGNVATWEPEPHTHEANAGIVTPNAKVAVAADGRTAVMTWIHDLDGTKIAVQAATLSNGSAQWESTFHDVSDPAPGSYASDPAVAISADGSRATVIFSNRTGVREDELPTTVRSSSGQITGGGSTWEATPHELSTSSANNPAIGLSAAGDRATAIWSTSNSGQSVIEATSGTIGDSSAVWNPVPTTLSATGSVFSRLSLGVAADGSRATALWAREVRIQVPNARYFYTETASAIISGTTGDWDSADRLTPQTQDFPGLQLGVSADGDQAIAAWVDGGRVRSSAADIIGRDAVWGEPQDVTSGDSAEELALGMSADGSRATAFFNGTDRVLQSSSMVRSYTVRFDSNGGTGTMSDQASDAPAALLPNQFTRADHTFAGWTAAADGSGAAYANEAEYAFRSGATLYAKWVAPTPPGPPVPPTPPVASQVALAGCVKDGKTPKVPRNGGRTLTAASCSTNAGQIVGTSFRTKTVRGDVVKATLRCKVGSSLRKTASTGYGDGSRYCPTGKLVIRTYGKKLKVTVGWTAPSAPGFTAYSSARVFRI